MGWGRVCGALTAALLAAALTAGVGGAGAARHAVTLTLAGSKQPYVPGQVLVRFRENADPLSRRAALSTESATTVKRLVLPGLRLVHVRGSVPDAVAALRGNPAVSYAEPNYLYHADAVPNDPRYGQLWGLARIKAPAAWNVTTGSPAVTVGVVDTGIATDHLDLAANVVPGHDFVDGDDDPRDFNGHGTHVAGTIGARGNNALGLVGVDWQVGLMPVRVLDGEGSGSNANVTAGLAYACTHGAAVVNASLGGTAYSTSMRDAIAACPKTLFVVAAGNNGGSDDTKPHYPCNYGAAPDNLPNVLCVAATDTADTLASFSNYGRSVDLAAPGVAIPSTWPAYDTLATDGFESLSGWTAYQYSGLAFGRSPLHTSGLYSASDSPGGPYQPTTESWLAGSGSMGSLVGRIGCRLFYNLRLDTQPNHDYFEILGSANGTTGFTGSHWSGSTGGIFIGLSSDMSAFDGQPQFFPALELVSDSDGTVGDGGYVDDLSLRCLRAASEAYATIDGTSMASPHVAGVAALVKAAHPGFSVAQVKAAILGGVDRLGSLRGRVASGGRLDACKAVGACGTAFTPPCVVPNVVGKGLAAARSAIRARHCTLGPVRYVKSARQKKGKVLRESPHAGKRLGADAKVSLWLGRGH